MTHLIPLTAILCYLGSSIAGLWKPQSRISTRLLAIGLFAQGFFLARLIFTGIPFDEFPFLLTAGSFLLVLSFALYFRFYRTGGDLKRLQIFLPPLASLLMICAGLVFHLQQGVPGVLSDANSGGNQGALLLHIIFCVLAVGALTFGFLLSIGVIIKERSLKRKRGGVLAGQLPPLMMLDTIQGGLFQLGLAAMILGLLSGLLLGWQLGWERLFRDPLALWTLGTAGTYLILYFARVYRGYRGSRAAWWYVIGFSGLFGILCLVTLLGGSLHVY